MKNLFSIPGAVCSVIYLLIGFAVVQSESNSSGCWMFCHMGSYILASPATLLLSFFRGESGDNFAVSELPTLIVLSSIIVYLVVAAIALFIKAVFYQSRQSNNL